MHAPHCGVCRGCLSQGHGGVGTQNWSKRQAPPLEPRDSGVELGLSHALNICRWLLRSLFGFDRFCIFGVGTIGIGH